MSYITTDDYKIQVRVDRNVYSEFLERVEAIGMRPKGKGSRMTELNGLIFSTAVKDIRDDALTDMIGTLDHY